MLHPPFSRSAHTGAVTALIGHVLSTPAIVVYLVVGGLVFAEDALFVGFVLPGETAAILGGVDAARHHVALWLLLVIVVVAEIVGDSVGYEIGRRFGSRVLAFRALRRHAARIDDARAVLARRGGWAVFFGRAVAFFRAVMPALAGVARMPYRRFLVFNAAGGLVWGSGAVLVGYLAGNSYAKVETMIGRGSAVVLAALVIVAVAVWHVRRRRSGRRARADGAVRRRFDEPEVSSSSVADPESVVPR
jgi:membrane-associated protein